MRCDTLDRVREAFRFVVSDRGYRLGLAIAATLALLLLATGRVGASLAATGGFAVWTAARVAGYLGAQRIKRQRR